MKKLKYAIWAFVICATFACKNAEKNDTKEVSTDNSKEKITTETTSEMVVEKRKETASEAPKTEKSSQKEQIFEGTFEGIEQGDYAYFKVKNAKEQKSLMVFNSDKTYEKISENPKKFIGKKVKVYWIATKEDVPEAGGKIDVDKYIKAEILN